MKKIATSLAKNFVDFAKYLHSLSRTTLVVIGVLLAFFVSFLIVSFLNVLDNKQVRKIEKQLKYTADLIESGYNRESIMVVGEFKRSDEPNIDFSPGAHFNFSFDDVVRIHDVNGKFIGEAGPGHELDLGDKDENIRLYAWSPKGPWKDDIYVCYRGCK